ncbi:hypothetical protein [Acidihalobacter ferrooxydans]|uniref:Uncharacterized protein n=1 Tax=Acidihalobacter ferrooxydans TaxID=1765967 RepID=A0A1P8UFJ2_9GAMM|nr:hypothetical protein [Acidihalobacter ferrooxydans]APZ42613.1 hypothetical protein BW247_05470 [Acidihalobacter ferrooxydans]
MHVLHRTPVKDWYTAELDFEGTLLAPEYLDLDWNPEQIELLQVNLLEASMRDLADPRTSQATAEDILSWVIENRGGPFGFKTCAALSGRQYGLEPEAAAEVIAEKAQEIMKRRFEHEQQHEQRSHIGTRRREVA